VRQLEVKVLKEAKLLILYINRRLPVVFQHSQ